MSKVIKFLICTLILFLLVEMLSFTNQFFLSLLMFLIPHLSCLFLYLVLLLFLLMICLHLPPLIWFLHLLPLWMILFFNYIMRSMMNSCMMFLLNLLNPSLIPFL
ncbi:hypothetical protein ACB092_12G100300 [Castanea dentata]